MPAAGSSYFLWLPPHRFLSCPLRKFGLAPTPGWSAQRHRRGRRPEGRNYPRPKLDLMPSPSYCLLVETGGRTPPLGRPAILAALERPSASSGHKNCTSHACSHTAASKRRAADATPGGRPLFLAALERPPLASAGAARHSKAGVCSDKPAGDDLSSEKPYSVRAPGRFILFRQERNS